MVSRARAWREQRPAPGRTPGQTTGRTPRRRGSTRWSGWPPTPSGWATRPGRSGCSPPRRPRWRPTPPGGPRPGPAGCGPSWPSSRGRPAEAVAPAEAALAAAGRGGSRRHVLKSRIVLAVARSAAGVMTPAAAVTELDAAAAECAGLGLLPLCWPAGLAALDLTPLPAAKPQVRINEQVASPAGTALGGRPDGTTRRRHAVHAALNVIEQRSDALGKRQMGESVWIPQRATLM